MIKFGVLACFFLLIIIIIGSTITPVVAAPEGIVTRIMTPFMTPRATRTAIPTVPPPPTPTPVGHAVTKGTIVFPLEPSVMCQDAAKLNISWIQSGWNLSDCPFIDEVGFIQWDEGQQALGDNLIIVWNELDQYGNDNGWLVAPCTAATRWHDIIEPQYQNYTLIGPGVMIWGRGWMKQFWTCYNNKYGHDPRMEYINVHCYSTGQGGRNCLTEFTQAAIWTVAHNRKLVISEYASLSKGNPYHCQPYGCPDCQTEAQGIAEARRVLDGLKQLEGVVAVAWYNTRTPGDDPGAMDCNSPLVDTNGNLTAFGVFYRDWH